MSPEKDGAAACAAAPWAKEQNRWSGQNVGKKTTHSIGLFLGLGPVQVGPTRLQKAQNFSLGRFSRRSGQVKLTRST